MSTQGHGLGERKGLAGRCERERDQWVRKKDQQAEGRREGEGLVGTRVQERERPAGWTGGCKRAVQERGIGWWVQESSAQEQDRLVGMRESQQGERGRDWQARAREAGR